MEYFKISLRPHKKIVNVDYCEGLIWESFDVLSKTGQVYPNFQVVNEGDSRYAVYLLMPGADALDFKYCSEDTVAAVEKLAGIFSLRIESVGSCITCEDSCVCEAPSWYSLYTDMMAEESPVLCGDCGKPVPLYKLPMILDNEGRSVFLNWQEQFKAMQKLDVYNYSAELEKDVYDPSSRLNKTARGLCRALEKAKNVPVFCHMERARATGNACPVCGNEMAPFAGEGISGLACEGCRVTSH